MVDRGITVSWLRHTVLGDVIQETSYRRRHTGDVIQFLAELVSLDLLWATRRLRHRPNTIRLSLFFAETKSHVIYGVFQTLTEWILHVFS